MNILDSYAYRTLVWDIYVERVSRPASGGAADAQKIAGALPRAEVCLFALSQLMDKAAWLAGASISLADLHAAPIPSVFRLAPEGTNLLGSHNRLREWWERVSTRPSLLRTRVPLRHERARGWSSLSHGAI